MAVPLEPETFPDILTGADFVRSDDVERIAGVVLGTHGRIGGVPRLRHVAQAAEDGEVRILFLLNRKPFDPAEDAGHDVAGKCIKAPGLWRDVTGWDIAIWIREYFWSRWGPDERQAALLHELLHVDVSWTKDNAIKVAVRKHDVEDFVDVARHYGPFAGEGAGYVRAANLHADGGAPAQLQVLTEDDTTPPAQAVFDRALDEAIEQVNAGALDDPNTGTTVRARRGST